LRDFAMALAAPGQTRPFEFLLDAIMTGQPTDTRALGATSWDYYTSHPEEGAQFARAMSNISAMVGSDIAANYDTGGVHRIVDVGGSYGEVLLALLEAAPSARGVLADLPEVIARAHDSIELRGMRPRVDLVACDFFAEVPAGGDLYVLKSVLHDWDDERALTIVRNCRRAAEAGTRLLIIEMPLPDVPAPTIAHLVDLAMLVHLGGRERKSSEYVRLLEAGGYRFEREIVLGSGWSAFEATAQE
jgi:hypothetical protein